MKKEDLLIRAYDRDLQKLVTTENSGLSVGQLLDRYSEIDIGFMLNNKPFFVNDIVRYKYYYVSRRCWSNLSDIPIIDKEVETQREKWFYLFGVISISNGDICLSDLAMTDIALNERIKKGESHQIGVKFFEEKKWDFEVVGNVYEHTVMDFEKTQEQPSYI